MRWHDSYTGFHHQTLSNGLTLYVQQRAAVSWFYAGFLIHAGAREDPKGRQGLAHLVERLVGENMDEMSFPELEQRVKTLGGQAAFGSVSYLSSHYHFHLPAEEEAIEEAFALFGRMLLTATISRKIAEEKEVIVREYHHRYSHQQDRAWKLQGRPFLFQEHPSLGSFESAIGLPEEFMQATQQELQHFYDTYYVPRNMSVVVIGPLAVQPLLEMLEESPCATPKAGQRNPLPEPFCPLAALERQEQVVSLAAWTGLDVSHASLTLEWVIPLAFPRFCVRIFGYLLKELLTEELRARHWLTDEVSTDSEYYQDCRTLRFEVELPADAVSITRDILWQHLRFIRQQEARFRDIKKAVLAILDRLDYSGYDLLDAAMADLQAYHRLIWLSEKRRQVEQTTFEQIVELASYLTPQRQFCFIVRP